MKKLRFVMLLLFGAMLFSSALHAQDVTGDSAYLTRANGAFLQNRVITYDNGAAQTITTPLGDTSQAFRVLLQALNEKANALAADARVVSRYRSVISDMSREAAAIRTATGRSPLDTIRATSFATMTATGWRIRTLTGTNDITFSVNASGTTRWRTDTATTFRAVLFLGPVLRLQSFPAAGSSTDLYRLPNGNYTNLDRTVVLLRPGSSTQTITQRSTAPPPSASRSAAPPTTETVAGHAWTYIDPETNAKYVLAPAEPGRYEWDGTKWTKLPATKSTTSKKKS